MCDCGVCARAPVVGSLPEFRSGFPEFKGNGVSRYESREFEKPEERSQRVAEFSLDALRRLRGERAVLKVLPEAPGPAAVITVPAGTVSAPGLLTTAE